LLKIETESRIGQALAMRLMDDTMSLRNLQDETVFIIFCAKFPKEEWFSQWKYRLWKIEAGDLICVKHPQNFPPPPFV